MSSTVTLAEYLFIRLQQLGIGAVHGVPGDFNLTLLDYVEPVGLKWVGNANELNAGYAADGYARIKGVGALVTTFGVGELSAINAIAGAYAERAAVVHIVGTPARPAQDARLLIHHTLNDGNFQRFGQMAAHVTVAQTDLKDPRTSPDQIDDMLKQCLLHSRPVYISFPVDMVSVPVSASRLDTKITPLKLENSVVDENVLGKVMDRIYSAKQPIIMVDGEVRALDIVGEVQEITKRTQWPTWTTSFGKGLLDETLPNFHGIYQGTYDKVAPQEFINNSDLVLSFGPHHSSTNSFAFTSIPAVEKTISFSDTQLKIGKEIFRDVPAKLVINRILEKLDTSKAKTYAAYPELPRNYKTAFSEVNSQEPIHQAKLWHLLANFLRPGDILLGETGTAGYGAREMPLPQHTRLFAPVTWLSIGYMLPAAQGAALAQQELVASGKYNGNSDARTILLIGDGSFQMTVQELGTIVNRHLNVVVFLINNEGYTIERCIHGLRQGYNDVPSWRYLQAPGFFGAKEDTFTASAKNWGELEKALTDERLINGKELRMVEIFMDREDAPAGPLLEMLQREKAKVAAK
ncbi:thiamine pyrophosphate enzyme [Corynespora cassiicola Philippines]|uniref:Pyruvate decarboxylase n=1 Tax=Corynespora cassiicola Philippines TaxID=1448308 RepID=A0A2T2P425_CORCC|nr:thiamine pyrophosphate enzyme [Corynespora cassiicola Philippines]